MMSAGIAIAWDFANAMSSGVIVHHARRGEDE